MLPESHESGTNLLIYLFAEKANKKILLKMSKSSFQDRDLYPPTLPKKKMSELQRNLKMLI